jgi:hypothetical protein
MIAIRMYRAAVARNAGERFDAFTQSPPKGFRPILRPALRLQAESLGLGSDELRSARGEEVSPWTAAGPSSTQRAEVFTDGTSLFVMRLVRAPRVRRGTAGREGRPTTRAAEPESVLYCHVISPRLAVSGFEAFRSAADAAFSVELEGYHFSSRKLEELKSRPGARTAERASPEELTAVRALADKATRTLAIAIKSTGGLLVSDLAKQLPREEGDKAAEIREALEAAKVIDTEVVVVCKKTQGQVARAPSEEALGEIAARGLRCACGRDILSERVERAITITTLGRELLDGSRWLSKLVVEELVSLGIPLEAILLEQRIGGDEMDCFAAVSNELVFFELKDKEFSLGNAYSFAAKIPLTGAEQPVIVTTECVGTDAKDHFEAAEAAARRSPYYDPDEGATPTKVRYIEGVGSLRNGLRAIVSDIHARIAVHILGDALPFATIDGASLVERVGQRGEA